MSAYTRSNLIKNPKCLNTSYSDVTSPTLSGEPLNDVETLSTLSKTELLTLCEDNVYVFTLCNAHPKLYNIITSPTLL